MTEPTGTPEQVVDAALRAIDLDPATIDPDLRAALIAARNPGDAEAGTGWQTGPAPHVPGQRRKDWRQASDGDFAAELRRHGLTPRR